MDECPALDWTWNEHVKNSWVPRTHQVHGSMKRPKWVPNFARKKRCGSPLEARVTVVMADITYDPVNEEVEGGEERYSMMEICCRRGHSLISFKLKAEGKEVYAASRLEGFTI